MSHPIFQVIINLFSSHNSELIGNNFATAHDEVNASKGHIRLLIFNRLTAIVRPS